jgi:hypothetical protein
MRALCAARALPAKSSFELIDGSFDSEQKSTNYYNSGGTQ